MNTPNKLTLLRIVLVPFFMIFILTPSIPFNYVFAFIIFLVASITDCVDGKIARSRNLVTDFGKFLDPLADKILVLSALICFLQINWTNAVIVVIILTRELLVTSLRLVASSKGTVISANIWGKIKTVSQMVAITTVLLVLLINQCFNLPKDAFYICYVISQIMLGISAMLTLFSGVIYLWQNRRFLEDA